MKLILKAEYGGTHLIPAYVKLRQEDHKFEANVKYVKTLPQKKKKQRDDEDDIIKVHMYVYENVMMKSIKNTLKCC
jgi:hypothetical protein